MINKFNKPLALIIFVFFIIISFSYSAHGQEPVKNHLAGIIAQKQWSRLPGRFTDATYKILEPYFSSVQTIKITHAPLANRLNYTAKFPAYGEIGVIVFEQKNNKYLKLEIKNQIKPLHFIRKFRKYPVTNLEIAVGDANFRFISGNFYQSIPHRGLLLFQGKWVLHTTPNDTEEQLTLEKLYKRKYFRREMETGVFLLEDKTFIQKLTLSGEVDVPARDAVPLFKMYRDAYGIKVAQFDEYWYLPFSGGTNLVVFQKNKDAFYYYLYNRVAIPDTRLIESDTQNMILSYNAYKGLKLSFGSPGTVSQVDLNLYLSPADSHISGTTTITYKQPANIRQLQLKDGLDLVKDLKPQTHDVNLFRRNQTYYLMGVEGNTISWYYKGQFASSEGTMEIFKARQGALIDLPADLFDSIYYLSRIQHFYPNPGNDFFKADITVKLPAGYNCLASGNLVEKTELGEERLPVFKFSSSSTKGISMVVGNFALYKRIETAAGIPLNFYAFDNFDLEERIDLSQVKEAFEEFVNRFGPLELSALDILIRRGRQEGGVSNSGFIVVNMPPDRARMSQIVSRAMDTPSARKLNSPVLLRDSTEDYIIHELGHQWWGGVISWNSYRDVWLSEGLSHFSLLYYLKKTLPEKDFLRLARKLKRWVMRSSDSGPIIYGTRISALDKQYEAFQSIVYNKSALVLMMLMEIIGEDDFFRRLRSVVKANKYKSIGSMQFIREFSGDNEMIKNFLRRWIYSRVLPLVDLSLVEDAKEYDSKKFKTVVLKITQLTDEPFIFPLKLKILTTRGGSQESVIITAREQQFVIKRDATIRSLNVEEDYYYPVMEKKKAGRFIRD